MQKIARLLLCAACLAGMLVSTVDAAEITAEESYIPNRRKPQFAKDYAYALFPYPYSLPGIGTGIGIVGGAMNIADTYTDAYGFIFGGEVQGAAFGVSEIHIVPKTFLLDVGYGTISEAMIQNYSQRGMNTNKHDFQLLEFGDTEYYGGRVTATFFDRRVEFYSAWYEGASKLKSIRSNDGTVIVEAQDSPRQRGHTTLFGARLDLTDDYGDPRRGVRFDVTHTQSPPQGGGPNFYVMDYNTTAYIPLGRRSTWAFNILRSDAVVVHPGETDRAKLEEQLRLNCSAITDPEQQTICIEAIDQVIDNIIVNNTIGTATTLGGFSRLRAYPQGRYKGAHTEFYGTEIRWNLTDERTPYDIFIMKDVRTSVQVALFYEIGSTADLRSEVGKVMRDAYGFGLRIVTASGVVFRGDLGFGREGVSPAIFIGYPWEI